MPDLACIVPIIGCFCAVSSMLANCQNGDLVTFYWFFAKVDAAILLPAYVWSSPVLVFCRAPRRGRGGAHAPPLTLSLWTSVMLDAVLCEQTKWENLSSLTTPPLHVKDLFTGSIFPLFKLESFYVLLEITQSCMLHFLRIDRGTGCLWVHVQLEACCVFHAKWKVCSSHCSA